jgi:hypothetical protein
MQTGKLVATALVLVGILHAELSVQNIEKMVEDIKAKRTSMMNEKTKIVSPFILIRNENNSTVKTFKPATVRLTHFTLGAIVNDAAYINGNWFRRGDKIEGFSIESISTDRVTLKQDDHKVVLFFKKAKPILTFSKE